MHVMTWSSAIFPDEMGVTTHPLLGVATSQPLARSRVPTRCSVLCRTVSRAVDRDGPSKHPRWISHARAVGQTHRSGANNPTLTRPWTSPQSAAPRTIHRAPQEFQDPRHGARLNELPTTIRMTTKLELSRLGWQLTICSGALGLVALAKRGPSGSAEVRLAIVTWGMRSRGSPPQGPAATEDSHIT